MKCVVTSSLTNHWWTTVYRVSTKQCRKYEVRCLASQTNPQSGKLCVLLHCLAATCKSQTIPTGVWTRSFWASLWAATVKLQQFVISEPDEVHHQSRAATDSAGWDKQACSHYTSHDVSVTSRLAKNISLTATFCWNILNWYAIWLNYETTCNRNNNERQTQFGMACELLRMVAEGPNSQSKRTFCNQSERILNTWYKEKRENFAQRSADHSQHCLNSHLCWQGDLRSWCRWTAQFRG